MDQPRTLEEAVAIAKKKGVWIPLVIALIGGGSCFATMELSVDTPHGAIHFHGSEVKPE